MTVTERSLYAEYGRTLVIRAMDGENTDQLFDKICSEFENTRIEQDSQGNVLIMAPTGGESSHQNLSISTQLSLWAEHDGRGKAFDSGVLFVLPDKSRLGPDGSWVSVSKLEKLSDSDRRKYLRVVPEFVIELKSPSDRMPDLKLKMQDWKRNGVELGWLIDPDARSVLIYRNGLDEAQQINGADKLSGEGPVAGFTLNLKPIWQGLRF